MARHVLRDVTVSIQSYSAADPPVLTGAAYDVPNLNEVVINQNFEDNSGYAFGDQGMVHDVGLENSDVSLTWIANDYNSGGVQATISAFLTHALPRRAQLKVGVGKPATGETIDDLATRWRMNLVLLQWTPIAGTAGGYATVTVGWPVDGVVEPQYT